MREMKWVKYEESPEAGGSISVSDHFWLCGQTEDYYVRGNRKKTKHNYALYCTDVLHLRYCGSADFFFKKSERGVHT